MKRPPMPGAADEGLDARIPVITPTQRREAAITVTEAAMRDGWVDDLRVVLHMLDLIERSA